MSDKSELMVKAEQVLINMIDKAAEIGSAAVDEIPLVVQELLMWKFADSIILCLGGILLALFWLWLYKKVYNFYSKDGDFELIHHPEITFLLFTIFGWIPVFEMVNLDWLKIWLAPRVYLLEYAASLVK